MLIRASLYSKMQSDKYTLNLFMTASNYYNTVNVHIKIV